MDDIQIIQILSIQFQKELDIKNYTSRIFSQEDDRVWKNKRCSRKESAPDDVIPKLNFHHWLRIWMDNLQTSRDYLEPQITLKIHVEQNFKYEQSYI